MECIINNQCHFRKMAEGQLEETYPLYLCQFVFQKANDQVLKEKQT